MISKAMEKAINQQINREFYSAYLYLAMAQECESIGLKGSAKWFTLQYHEEISHGMKMIDYMNDQGARVVLDAIEKSAKTGRIGDGKIFVSSIEEAVRIRTGERGRDAI